MLEKVKEMLALLGYEMQDGDEALLEFCVEKVTSEIKNDINWTRIPEGLMPSAIGWVLGEFLSAKKTFAPDSIAGLDLSEGIKSLSEGDKSTSFTTGESTQTDEQRLDSYINKLLTDGREQLSCFRRLRWS